MGGSYKPNFAVPASEEFQTVVVPFTDFTYKWSDTTGEPTVKCADDASVCPTEKYLKGLKTLEIMAEGVEGSFHLEVKSITAVNTASGEHVASFIAVADAASVPLTTFDGAAGTTQSWRAMNDPVMGGKSKATFTVDSNAGVFDGAVAIVPSLQAPDFCTMESPRGSFPD